MSEYRRKRRELERLHDKNIELMEKLKVQGLSANDQNWYNRKLNDNLRKYKKLQDELSVYKVHENQFLTQVPKK